MAKQVKTKSIEESLWQACDKLRGSVESSEYKHVVLGLIFLKFASDKFEERREELIAEGKEKYVEMKDFYNMKNVFFLNETSRWSFIKANAKQDDLALKIDTALHNIEKNNPALKGALPDNYFSRLGLDKTKLASLIDQISEINTIADKQNDIVGRVYEYFLAKFAIKEGKGKGEFYTPKSIVNLIAEMIEPYQGIIYDPACGSGGMFVQSVKFLESHHGNKKEVSVYGQEYTNTTYKLAKMNLAIRGISANLGEKAADTFGADQHPDFSASESIYIGSNENPWYSYQSAPTLLPNRRYEYLISDENHFEINANPNDWIVYYYDSYIQGTAINNSGSIELAIQKKQVPCTRDYGPILDDKKTPTFVNELVSNNFNFYPNPFEQSLIIEVNEPIQKFEVKNILGQSIKFNTLQQGKNIHQLNITERGFLFVSIYFNNRVESFKIIAK